MALASALTLVLATSGCYGNTRADRRARTEEPPKGFPAANPVPTVPVQDANFTLYVTNQSFERPTMPIMVTINGREVVSAVFETGNQHVHVRFPLRLLAGPTTIVARAGDGTVHESTFVLPKDVQRWGVLSFWASAAFYAPKFDWQLMNEEPHFA